MDVFAIGHSNYSMDKLLDLLKQYEINCIVDIRGIPYSTYNVQFNREVLQECLIKNGFVYIYMGKEFGANRVTRESYNVEGYAEFNQVVNEVEFLQGVKRLRTGCLMGYRIALLGAMQETIRCHRSILVGRFLSNHGFTIHYISDDGSLAKHNVIEEQLLEKYFPERQQLTFEQLLGNEASREDLLEECYRKANREIGFRVEKL